MNQSLCQRKYLRPPKCSRLRHQYPFRHLSRRPPHRKRSLTPKQGDMVYVPGFGWLECQGEGTVIYADMMYENGNKVGSMG